MEWNTMTPSLWDWESVVSSNGRLGEAAKQVQSIDWGIEGDGGIDDGSVYSSGGGGGCSGSDLGNGSTSKGSGSASVDSSSKRGVQESKLKLQMIKDFPNDLNKNKELGRAQVAVTSQFLAKVGSGEPVIGLKLGKRTYFEDICAESSVKVSSASPTSSDNSIKKSKVSYHSMQIPRCQVEGCNLDLTAAKEYHRKHRVCENHSKCSLVIIAGNERRFCQQCSRFHELSEFDEKKRSCRRRLSDHNARRRKPQTEAISFNSARLSSSFYGGKQHMNLVLNRLPPAHARPAANATWETPCSFQTVQVKESWLKTEKASGIGGHLHLPNAELPAAVPMICHDFYKLSPFKGTSAEVLNQGQEASSFASNFDMPPDFRRALSLLSPNKWGLAHRGPAPLDQLMHVNNSCTDQQAMHLMHQVLPFASSEYWQAEQSESRHLPLSLHSHSSHLQEFQLFKAPYESASLDNNHIH